MFDVFKRSFLNLSTKESAQETMQLSIKCVIMLIV